MTPTLPRDVVALVNGGPPGTAIMTSRALHYGDGVFRTLLRFEGRWLDVDRHYVKLVQDCRALDLDPPHLGQLQAELEALGGGRSSPQVGKVILARSGAGRGYAPTGRSADRILLRYPAPKFDLANYYSGITVIASPVVLGHQPALAGVKHLNRLENILASRHWPAGVQEALMSDSQGHLICGSRSNVFWLSKGTLYTPKLNSAGVAGMMRARILELARSQGWPTQQVDAPLTRLLAADEAFISNSIIGLWPIAHLADTTWPAPGPYTCQLQSLLAHPVLADSQGELPLL